MIKFQPRLSKANGVFIFLVYLTILFAFKGKEEEEKLVFSTAMFTDEKSIEINGKTLKFTVDENCTGEMPRSCESTLVFEDSYSRPVKLPGTAYRFAAADLNEDGTSELVVLVQHNGNWREVQVLAAKSLYDRSHAIKNIKWYACLESFMWYPGFEGENYCDARIYHTLNGYVVLTTNPADENFACTQRKTLSWKND